MNWAVSKHPVNSGKPHAGNPEPSRGVTPEGAETRHGTSKTCSVCKIEKPETEFYVHDRASGKRASECKRCRIIRQRERNLGVTQAQYNEMHKSQDGRCGICQKRLRSRRYKAFAVDHCHTTGRIRGLLCNRCNLGLGNFDDDAEKLVRAAKWVKV